MYKDFFHFNQKPFSLNPDPEFLYLSKSHKKAITYLNYGIKEKVGFILFTGEVGAGKTTIIRTLLKKLDKMITISKVTNTRVSSEQLIAMINEDFGLDVKDKDKITLISELNEFLIEQYALENQSVLIIDEAQNLGNDLLEEIRLLSNLETDKEKLLQIILIGQPELREILATPQLKQLRQRISVNCHLLPLSSIETEAYIYHRLHIAGGPGELHFEKGVMNVIYQFSRGIPRLINILCDFVLLAAFVEKTKEISLDLVKEIVGDLEMNQYWNDHSSVPTSSPSNEKESSAYDESILNDISSRLSRLEEIIENQTLVTDDIFALYEKIKEIENKIKILASIYNQFHELNDRVVELETSFKSVNNTSDTETKDSAPEKEDKGPIDSSDTDDSKEKTNFFKRIFGIHN